MKNVDFNTSTIDRLWYQISAPFPGCTGGKLLLLLYDPGL